MKSLSGKDFARILERNGWNLLRVQGSHHIYGKPGVEARISVPIHSGTVLKKGLLHHLLTVAGIEEKDL
jgi:predicted RNA binding protein YcfA (HicA-like mRNA interferase family)